MAEVIGQTKSAFVTANGVEIVEPTPSGYGIDALTKVTINTNVEDEHLLVTKKVTENGDYVAPEGQAFSKVVVDVTADLESIDIVSNGTYEPEEGKDGWNKIVVDVPSDVNNQDKTVTENGIVIADLGYSGLGQVTVAVEPTDEQKEEYRQEGRDEQKAKLTTISVTENGVYTKDDGYSRVTVDVHASEEEKQAERDAQKALDKAAVEALSPVHENGSYPLIGATLVVDVPASEEELAEAKAEQLAADKESVKGASPITENGVKTILGEAITVDVEPSAEEIAEYKQEGKNEQLSIDQRAIDQLNPITDNGNYGILGRMLTVNVEGGGVNFSVPDQSLLTANDNWLNKQYNLSFVDDVYDFTLKDAVATTFADTYSLGDLTFPNQMSNLYIETKKAGRIGNIRAEMNAIDMPAGKKAHINITGPCEIGNIDFFSCPKDRTATDTNIVITGGTTSPSLWSTSVYSNGGDVSVPELKCAKVSLQGPHSITVDKLTTVYLSSSSGVNIGELNIIGVCGFNSSNLGLTREFDNIYANHITNFTLGTDGGMALPSATSSQWGTTYDYTQNLYSEVDNVYIKLVSYTPNTVNFHLSNLKGSSVNLIDFTDSALKSVTLSGEPTSVAAFVIPADINSLSVKGLKIDRASALILISALPVVESSHTLTISSVTSATLTSDEIAQAVAKGWTIQVQ